LKGASLSIGATGTNKLAQRIEVGCDDLTSKPFSELIARLDRSVEDVISDAGEFIEGADG